ncbi:MAG: hypothetical protein IKW27_06780 [Bacteroidales bacterium]|nr:hypothetical protein [Bacteroidales bacterium]
MDLEVRFDLFEIIATASQMKFKDLGVENALIIVEKRRNETEADAAILVGGKTQSGVIRMVSRAMEEDPDLMNMVCLSSALAIATKNCKKDGDKG